MNRSVHELDDGLEPLRSSFDQFRRSLDDLEPPEFKPRRPLGPAVAMAAVALAGGIWLAGSGGGGVETGTTGSSMVSTDTTLNTEPIDPVAEDETLAEVRMADGATAFDVVPSAGDGANGSEPASESAVVPLNNAVSAWNADGSMLLLYRSGGVYLLVSPDERRVTTQLDLDSIDIEHVFWDPVDPGLLHTLTETGLTTVDVSTGDPVADVTVPDCRPVAPAALAPSVSPLGQVGLRCQSTEGDRWLVVDLDGTVLAQRSAEGGGSPAVSPTGRHIVVAGDDDRVVVYDADFEQQVAAFTWDQSIVLTIDGAGRDVLVGPEYTDEAAIGALVVVDLATGAKRVVIGPDTGEPYPMPGIEVAASPNGIVLLGAGWADGGEPGGETLTAGSLHRINLGDGAIMEIAESTGRATGDGPWDRWFPDLSADGRRLAFATVGPDGQVITRVLP